MPASKADRRHRGPEHERHHRHRAGRHLGRSTRHRDQHRQRRTDRPPRRPYLVEHRAHLCRARSRSPGPSWSKVTSFTVPAGVGYLDTHLATDPNPASGFVDIQLVDPSGRFAEAALTQGNSDTANAGVRLPEAGTWTAYLEFGRGTSSGAASTQFVATAQRWTPFGTVTPSHVTVAPGQSATVQATFVTPAAAGDESAAVSVADGNGVATSIPVGAAVPRAVHERGRPVLHRPRQAATAAAVRPPRWPTSPSTSRPASPSSTSTRRTRTATSTTTRCTSCHRPARPSATPATSC